MIFIASILRVAFSRFVFVFTRVAPVFRFHMRRQRRFGARISPTLAFIAALDVAGGRRRRRHGRSAAAAAAVALSC